MITALVKYKPNTPIELRRLYTKIVEVESLTDLNIEFSHCTIIDVEIIRETASRPRWEVEHLPFQKNKCNSQSCHCDGSCFKIERAERRYSGHNFVKLDFDWLANTL